MIRKSLLALVLIGGLAAASGAVAGPFFGRPQPPTAAALGLNPAQASQWQAIQSQAQSLRQTTLKQVASELGDAKLALAAPNADLRAIGAGFQTIAIDFLSEQRQVRDQRLAFYDSLNPAQQAQVRDFLIEQIERAERALRAVQVLQGE